MIHQLFVSYYILLKLTVIISAFNFLNVQKLPHFPPWPLKITLLIAIWTFFRSSVTILLTNFAYKLTTIIIRAFNSIE